MIRILSETEYVEQAQPILQQVLDKNRLYEQPFSARITEKVIVFPVEILPEPFLINGIFAGARQVGDRGCYYTQLWRSKDEPNDCYIPLSELREVCGVPSTYPLDNTDVASLDLELYMNLVRENVFYSATGKWGLINSHERFGMLGGSPEFIEAVRRFVPNLDNQVYELLKDYQLSKAAGMHLTLEWLPVLLTHIYGQKAEKLLEETGFT